MGVSHVALSVGDGMEHYSWKKVTTSVNNLIVGTLWVYIFFIYIVIVLYCACGTALYCAYGTAVCISAC